MLQYLDGIIPPRAVSSPRIEYLLTLDILHKFVLLGSNDASRRLDTDPTSQHVPLERFGENIRKIITHPNVAAHNPQIFLVTPPPIDQIRVTELDTPIYGQPRRHTAISAAYSQKVRDVASETPGVILIDLWNAIMNKAVEMTPGFQNDGAGPMLGTPECGKRGAFTDLLPDGLHMNAEGYKVFFDIVVPHIGRGWLKRENYVYPLWQTLNTTCDCLMDKRVILLRQSDL